MATILIVDDRAVNRDFLVALLQYSGHRLLEATDGCEALGVVRAEHPDLVIADILMPTMDGYELVRQLRADPAIADTPVIFFTANYHEREAQALAATCGVSSVITKPAEPEAVLLAVEAALAAAPPAVLARPTEEFDREHLRLLTNKLSEKAADLRIGNERLSALVELDLHLGSELDPHRLLQNLGESAREIIGARYSITALLSADGLRFQSLFTSGMNAENAARMGSPDPRTEILRTILVDGRCTRRRNPGSDPAAIGLSPSHPPVHAWLGVPIASPTKIYGYVGLVDKIGLDEFSEEDERLARILSAKVGRVYENGSLYADVLRHASHLEKEIAAHKQTEKVLAEHVRHALLMGEVGAILTRTDTTGEMLRLCAEAMVRHLGIALARIWTLDSPENALELKASAGLYTHILGPHSRISLDELTIGRIARERTPYVTNNVIADFRVTNDEWATREGLVAFAGYPLLVEERLFGVVAIFARQSINPATCEAIGAVARQFALGLERIRAQEALRERDEHIRLLLDSTAEAIYGVDLNGYCTFANAACARLLGYAEPSRFLGHRMHDLIHRTPEGKESRTTLESTIVQASLQGQGTHVDHAFLWRSDGSGFPAEYWSFPIHSGGRVAGSVVTFLDITERQQLEEQFRAAQLRLRHVVASSPSVLFTAQIAGSQIHQLNWTSDNLKEIFGYFPEAVTGSDWWMANVHEDDRERVRTQTIADLLSIGQSTEEYQFRHGDGLYRWTRCEIRLMRDEDGRASEAVGAWSDVTGRKRAEAEQSKLREQLQQAQKLESVGRLAGGVAHDFNNLLTVINGYSDMLLKELDSTDPIQDSVREIRTAGERGAALSQQLLVLSRRQVIQPKSVNLNEIIAEVETMLGRVIGEDIRLESVLDPSLGRVLADPGQLHQILMNLAINARDAMPDGGTVLIESSNAELTHSCLDQHVDIPPGPYVQLRVTDTGTGISKEVMTHLFEPFFTTKKEGEGTGLGLATVYGIVKHAGGSIRVYSELGNGTAFTIYLPRMDHEIAAPPGPECAPPTLRGAETILVVEDQEQLRRMAGRVLRDYGYKVLEAANGAEALLLCERYLDPIHLMLTDIVMPEMTGPELGDRIKSLRPSMAVVFMSGYSERAILERRNLSLSGVYLPKPFSPEALVTKVREALGSSVSPETILVVDDEVGPQSGS